jgi:hypothetical protein
LDNTLITLHGVEPGEKPEGSILGPIPTATVSVEGNPAKALIDTGSPVSIISLEFLVKMLASEEEGQSPEVIRESVKSRLQPAPFHLKSYSGQNLLIVKQVRAKLSHGSYSIEAYIQVQKDTPVELLLGTDLQPQLGFLLLDVADEKHPLNLLKTEAVDNHNQDHDETPTQSQVCLLHAAKVPARHARKVQVQVQQSPSVGREYALFQPTDRLAQITGLVIEEALVPLGDIATLVVTNPSMHPIQLEGGQYIGDVSTVELAQELDTDVPVSAYSGSVCGVSSKVAPSLERHHHLLAMLNQEQWSTDEETQQQLRSLALEYEDIFAVDDSELGRAQDVTHMINTGDEHPIRQHPRRIPFALRSQV